LVDFEQGADLLERRDHSFPGADFFLDDDLTADEICTKYIEEDESAPFILAAVIVAAIASLFAIVEPLATIKQVSGPVRVAHFGLAALTLNQLVAACSYDVHHALRRHVLTARKKTTGRCAFRIRPTPVWDFAYFSFTIAAACQTADVATEDAEMRKLVIAQTLISFLFNASILGFAINVTAGVIGGS